MRAVGNRCHFLPRCPSPIHSSGVIMTPTSSCVVCVGIAPQGNAGVEPIVGETVLSVAVEEVENVVGEESIEVARAVQHSESVMVAATSDGKLEVKSDGCRCVEAALCERQPAPIWALAQLGEETGRWNSCLAVQRMQEKLEVGKVAEEFLLPSRSPLNSEENILFFAIIYLIRS